MGEMERGTADARSRLGSLGCAGEQAHVQVLLGKSAVIFPVSKRYHV